MSNDANAGYNPYAPPTPLGDSVRVLDGAGDAVLAMRGTRLGARLLDGLLAFAAMVPASAIFVAFTASHVTGRQPSDAARMIAALLLRGGVTLVLFQLPLWAYQWHLLATRGQTLGKRWMRVRVVKLDGAPVDFVSGVVMREWIVGALGFVPYLGALLSLVDDIMIFGEERRCLHDLIAGTKVIVA